MTKKEINKIKCISCKKGKVEGKDNWWCSVKCKEKFFVEYYGDSFIRIKYEMEQSNNPENQRLLDRAKEVGFVEAIIECGEDMYASKKN